MKVLELKQQKLNCAKSASTLNPLQNVHVQQQFKSWMNVFMKH